MFYAPIPSYVFLGPPKSYIFFLMYVMECFIVGLKHVSEVRETYFFRRKEGTSSLKMGASAYSIAKPFFGTYTICFALLQLSCDTTVKESRILQKTMMMF